MPYKFVDDHDEEEPHSCQVSEKRSYERAIEREKIGKKNRPGFEGEKKIGKKKSAGI